VDLRAERPMQMSANCGLSLTENRPFDGGDLLRRFAREPPPGLARELDG